MEKFSRSIKLFLEDGSPKGIIHAEIMNWTGHVSLVPRMRIAEYCAKQKQFSTGIYILMSETNEFYDRPKAYIGESDNVRTRLLQHSKDENKDFTDKACVITSKDTNLTKTHAKYLESRLIQIASNVRRCELMNGTAPIYETLPDADIADMEYFINQVQLVLPVLGIHICQPQSSSTTALTQTATTQKTSDYIAPALSVIRSPIKPIDLDTLGESPTFELIDGKLDAYAKIINGEFVLLRGSEITSTPKRSDPSGKLRERYSKENRISMNVAKGCYVANENISFNSPSGAACFVVGRSANGRIGWKVKGTNQTFADWEETQNPIDQLSMNIVG